MVPPQFRTISPDRRRLRSTHRTHTDVCREPFLLFQSAADYDVTDTDRFLRCSHFACYRLKVTRLWPLYISAASGVLSVSTLAWIFPKPQYIAPALICAAAVSGVLLALPFDSDSKIGKSCSVALLALALVQFLSLILHHIHITSSMVRQFSPQN